MAILVILTEMAEAYFALAAAVGTQPVALAGLLRVFYLDAAQVQAYFSRRAVRGLHGSFDREVAAGHLTALADEVAAICTARL